MSTHVNDLAAGVAVYAALPPSVRTASVNGSAIDLISADGPCFAVQQVGAISVDAAWGGRFEESSSGSGSWSAIDDAEFELADATDDVQTITFHRTKRYVRYVGTVGGTDPSVPVAVFVGEQKKTF